MSNQDPSELDYPRGFRARLDRIIELIVGSSFGAAILYSVFWGAFQSLAIGHFILNEGRFVAASSAIEATPTPPKTPAPTSSSDESDTTDATDTGDVIEIWYASAKHGGLLLPCHLDFEFTGMNLTNYKFGSDRRTNPRQAKYLPVLGLEKNPKLPGPYIYLHFESALGSSSRNYQLVFDYKKDQAGNIVGLPTDKETFVATSTADLTPWECLSIVFIGGGFKLTDFSDFNFIKAASPNAVSSQSPDLTVKLNSSELPRPTPIDQGQQSQRHRDH